MLLDFATVIATELIPTVLFTYVLVIQYNILWTRDWRRVVSTCHQSTVPIADGCVCDDITFMTFLSSQDEAKMLFFCKVTESPI